MPLYQSFSMNCDRNTPVISVLVQLMYGYKPVISVQIIIVQLQTSYLIYGYTVRAWCRILKGHFFMCCTPIHPSPFPQKSINLTHLIPISNKVITQSLNIKNNPFSSKVGFELKKKSSQYILRIRINSNQI